MDNIVAFTKNQITPKTAKQYIDIMNELVEKLETLDASVEQKKSIPGSIYSVFLKCASLIVKA